MPRGLSSWRTWSVISSLSISLSRYCNRRTYIIFYFKMLPYILTCLFFVSILPCLCVMWFQAINKGPSRLPGSTVDIRIPNRLAGSGADMFHIIETQVDSSSSLSTLFIQAKLLFISLFNHGQPHTLAHSSSPLLSVLLLFMAQLLVSTSEDTFMYRELLKRRAGTFFQAWGANGPVKI